jgi:hypothetical protein
LAEVVEAVGPEVADSREEEEVSVVAEAVVRGK